MIWARHLGGGWRTRVESARALGRATLRAPRVAARVLALRASLDRRLDREDLRQILGELSEQRREARLGVASEVEIKAADAIVRKTLAVHPKLKATCLLRSTIRFAVLQELGVPVELVLGLHEENGELLGHAWLERDGAPWGERLRHDYRVTFRSGRDLGTARRASDPREQLRRTRALAVNHGAPAHAARALLLGLRLPRIPTWAAPRERRFLIAALANDGRALDALAEGPLDWALLLRLAERFALAGLVGDRVLARRGLPLSAPLATRLAAARDTTGLQNRMWLSEATRVAGALLEAEIPHVFMKGVALLAHTHPRPMPRHTDDIDVLVPGSALARVEAALLGAGFVALESPPHPMHPLLAVGPLGALIEVHVAVRGGFGGRLFEDARPCAIDGVPLAVTSPAGLLEHLSHHVLVQHADAPRYLPRHLLDLSVLAGLAPGGGLELLRRSNAGLGPSVERAVLESLELHQLLEASREDEAVARALASLLFPERHLAFHGALARRRARGHGGWRGLLASARRLPGLIVSV